MKHKAPLSNKLCCVEFAAYYTASAQKNPLIKLQILLLQARRLVYSNSLVNTLLSFLIQHGYAVLFAWVLLEQLGLPIPAAPLLLAAGALVGSGNLAILPIFLVIWSASLFADLAWYTLGRRRGDKVIPFLCRISLSPDTCVGRAKDIFSRQGDRSLLVAKFLPGVNTITPPLAGIFRMRLTRFIFWDTLGIVLWVIVLVGLGFQFSDQLEWIGEQFMRLGNGLGVVLLGGLAGTIAWKTWQRQRVMRQLPWLRISPEEVKEKLENENRPLILDVRTELDIQSRPEHLPGAFHLPLNRVRHHVQRIPRHREVILYCT
jgi:membrane protein DedA with SNARE-associated domain